MGICDDIDKTGLMHLGFNLIWFLFSIGMYNWAALGLDFNYEPSEYNRCYIGNIDGVPAASNVTYVFDDVTPFNEMTEAYMMA